MNSLISVIVPVYNVEKYLSKCVNSILAQTYQNFEIILVEDGSSDGSRAICDSYAAKDGRVHVIYQTNKGVSSARNAGIGIASGEYIMFVDSDDYLREDCFYTMLDQIQGCDYVACGLVHEDADGTKLECSVPTRIIELTGVQALRNHYSLPKIDRGIEAVHVWGKLYRRSLFESLRFQNELLFEDIHLMPYLLLKCQKVRFIPYVGYYYVQHNSSITNRKDSAHAERLFRDSFRIWEDHLKLYDDYGLGELACQIYGLMADKILAHAVSNSIPAGWESWSLKTYWHTVRKLLACNFPVKKKLWYILFALIGPRGYKICRSLWRR